MIKSFLVFHHCGPLCHGTKVDSVARKSITGTTCYAPFTVQIHGLGSATFCDVAGAYKKVWGGVPRAYFSSMATAGGSSTFMGHVSYFSLLPCFDHAYRLEMHAMFCSSRLPNVRVLCSRDHRLSLFAPQLSVYCPPSGTKHTSTKNCY